MSEPTLREQIAKALYEHDWPGQSWEDRPSEEGRQGYRRRADAVLALPALREAAATCCDHAAGVECACSCHLSLDEIDALRAAAPALDLAARCSCGHRVAQHGETGCQATRYRFSGDERTEPCGCRQIVLAHAAPVKVDVEPIHCLDCPRPEECGGVVDPAKIALVQATRRPAQVDALAHVTEAMVTAALCAKVPLGCAPDPCTYESVEYRKQHGPFPATCYLDATQMRAVLAAALRARSASPAPGGRTHTEVLICGGCGRRRIGARGVLYDVPERAEDHGEGCSALASLAASSPAPTQPEESET